MALDPKRRYVTWLDWLQVNGFIVLYVVTQIELRRWLPPAWALLVEVAVSVAFVTIVGVFLVSRIRASIEDRRAFRTLRVVRDGGRWPLGEPYAVELDAWCNGGRVWHTMRIDERGVNFRPRGPLSRRSEFVGVSAVRVHASWIEIVSGAESVRVVPRSYADRERMLWELAVRWSHAFVFDGDETAPRPTAAPAIDGSTDVSDLDQRMTGSGLASALVGPAASANPAPPRKSGLGVGLFPPPPGDPRESSM